MARDISAPSDLVSRFQEKPEPIELTAPYDLRATYDENATWGVGYISVGGFDAHVFGDHLATYTQNIGVVGYVASDFGQATLFNLSQFTRVFGIQGVQFGTASLINKNKWLSPVGFRGASINLGVPWISNFTQRLYPQGFVNESTVDIPGFKWPYPQTVAPHSLVPLVFGTAFVDQTIRRITLTAGVTTYAVGNLRVWFRTRDIYVPGGDYLRVGRPEIVRDVIVLPVSRTLEAPGTDVAAYGRAKIESTFKTVYPDSLSIPRFPTPSVAEYDSRTFVYVNGMSTYMVTTPQIKQPYQLIGSKFWGDPQPSTQVGDQTVFGLHKFDWHTRYLAASGRVSSVVSTKHEIRDRAFYVQAISATRGGFFGASDLNHEVRTLRPTGTLVTGYGHPQLRLEKASIYPGFIFAFGSGAHMVGDGVRGLKVGGLPSSEAVGGRLRIEHHARAVFSTSWLSASFSPYSHIRDARQSIAVSSVVPPEFLVNSIISNRNAYIQVHFYAPSGVEVALFGNTFVRDHTSRLLPSSIDRLRFGLATSVDYHIGDIAYVRIPNAIVFGITVVGHRVRWVRPEGFLSEVVSQQAHSRNTAMLLRGVGFDSVRLGTGSVFNLNRNVRVSSVPIWSSVSYGGFAAPRVRELSIFGVRPTTYIPQTHWVSNGLRVLKPQGMFENTMSARWETEVFERFNRVRPYWSTPLRPPFGEALVVLRNKTVRPYGYDYFESGRAQASLYDRVLPGLTLGPTQLFGRLTIRDKRTEVRLSGASISNTFVSRSLTIRNLLPDPPWTRELLIAAYTHVNRVSTPWVRGNTLYPSSVYGGSAFPPPSLRRNTIAVYTGISEYNWGSTIVAGPQYLSVGAFNIVSMGRPRMSPYNIYAPEGSEQPAGYGVEWERGVDNHVVDYYAGTFGTSDKNSTAWVPQPQVEYFHRKIAAIGVGVVWPEWLNPRPIVVRNAEIPKERQFVQLRGSSYLRVGWVTLSPFPQEVLVVGIRSSEVEQPWLRGTELFICHIQPTGMDTFAADMLQVSLYNRYIQGWGVDVSLYGEPIIWFAKRYIYPSGVMSRVELSNNAWVSNRIRTIAPLGEDMFNPEVAFYKNTTKVQNQYQGAVLSAKGFGSSSFGEPDVGLFRKYVRRAGGIFPVPANRVRVKSRSTLSAQGFEASSFGNVRKWEANLIQVHEYQEPSAGVPVVSTPHQVGGFASSVVDYPIIAAHIGPQGIESEDVGATVLKNEICCGGCG